MSEPVVAHADGEDATKLHDLAVHAVGLIETFLRAERGEELTAEMVAKAEVRRRAAVSKA